MDILPTALQLRVKKDSKDQAKQLCNNCRLRLARIALVWLTPPPVNQNTSIFTGTFKTAQLNRLMINTNLQYLGLHHWLLGGSYY